MMRPSRSRARFRPAVAAVTLLVGVLAFSAHPAAAQFIATWVPLERMDPGPTIGAGFAVAHNGERPTELLLTAHRIQDGRVVATHRSKSFRVSPDRPFRLDERYLPAPRFYDGKVAGEIVITTSPVPLASGERDVNVWWESVKDRFITDWGEFSPDREWQQRDALLLIVSPTDARLRSEAMAHPLLVQLKAPAR